MQKNKTIGYGVQSPKKVCTDPNCPFHGTLKTRGKQFTGTVVSSKMQRSAKVEWQGSRYVSKYERYKKTRTRITAHNPECISAREGDKVKVFECRHISKTKNFVIVAVAGEEKTYKLKKESLEEGKHKDQSEVDKTEEKKPVADTKSKTAKKEVKPEEENN